MIRVIPEFGLIHFLGQLIQLFADMVNVEGIARGKQGFTNLCQFAAILGNIYERHVLSPSIVRKGFFLVDDFAFGVD